MASKAFLQQAYLAYFGRPADPSGLAYYAEASEAAVKAAFSASPESQAFFGSMEVVAKINAIYQNLFNRDAEPAGLTYWSQEIGAGRLSLADAAMGILAGAQNDDKTAVANKLAASEAFTAALDTTAEILGYAGAAAIAPARAYLQSVDATAASLTAATTGVAASVSSVVAAGTSNLNVGQTFALTAGIDNIVGTAGNDTINAYATSVTAAGANATTLGANDVVDGGAGVDTLNIEVLAAAGGEPARNASIQGSIKNVEKVFITNGADLADATLDVTKLGAQLQEAWQVTSAKGVSGVTTQAVGFKNVADAAGATVAVAYGATTKSGTIALDNSGKSGLTVDVQGAALETLNVAGSVKAASAAAAGTLNLTDDANGAGAGTVGSVKTLNLNLSTAAIVSVAGLDQLTTIASTGAGGLNLGATLTNKVKTVTTGAGDDTLTLATATSATTNASVSTGAGKDTITVSTTSLTAAGTVTIDAGAGDDGVVFTRALNVRDKVDGGDGKDTLTVVGTALIAEDYEVLKAVVSNVETLKFSEAMVGADASKLAQFGGFSFTTTGSSITKVADAQTLAVAIAAGGSLAATAAGYIAKDTGATPAVASTTYAGTLTVEASGGTRIDGDDGDAIVNYGPNDVVTPTVVDAKANAINLTVKATPATAAAAGVESNVYLTGDLTTATVNLVNSVNAATGATATGDALAVFSMAPTLATVGGAATKAFTNLGGLTTLNVTGNGYALIDATGANTALKTVDASGMTGVASYDATKTSGGLKMLANNAVAETITLGGGLDVIVTSSTYDKMDTITGLKLVASAVSATTVDATKSDDISVAGVTTFAKTTVTGATLGLAFVDAAAKAGANLVFQYDGNTYIYVDAVGAGVLDNGDTAIKLTGLVDLDLLVSALNA